MIILPVQKRIKTTVLVVVQGKVMVLVLHHVLCKRRWIKHENMVCKTWKQHQTDEGCRNNFYWTNKVKGMTKDAYNCHCNAMYTHFERGMLLVVPSTKCFY